MILTTKIREMTEYHLRNRLKIQILDIQFIVIKYQVTNVKLRISEKGDPRGDYGGILIRI